MISFLLSLAVSTYPGVADIPLPDTPASEHIFAPAPTPSSNLTKNERVCMTHIIYHEARGETIQGQLAVASVVLTRTAADRWSDTICGNAKWSHAFSFVNPDTKKIPSVDEPDAWQQAWLVAGLLTEPLPYLPGVDHYHTTDVDPYWNTLMYPAGQIGNHLFFRDPDTQYTLVTPLPTKRPTKDNS